MSALLRPAVLLLLGLSLAVPPASCSRLRVPPHDQVARMARFIAHRCDWASMATVSSHPPVVGQPFSNVFSVSDGPPGSSSGVPYLYLTRMEVSVQDLQVNPQASLSMSLAQTDYCRQQGFDPQSPLCAHIILSGSVLEVNGTEAEFAKKSLFVRHPEMIDWPTDHNWFFAKFNITQVWVLDYFGGVKTVAVSQFLDRKTGLVVSLRPVLRAGLGETGLGETRDRIGLKCIWNTSGLDDVTASVHLLRLFSP